MYFLVARFLVKKLFSDGKNNKKLTHNNTNTLFAMLRI